MLGASALGRSALGDSIAQFVNTQPVVEITGNTTVQVNSSVTLSSTITDPDADSHTYTWRVISGTATLSSTSTASINVTPTVVSPVTIGLVVNDGTDDSVEDTFALTVTEIPDTTAPVINLLGSSPIIVYQGQTYIDAGAIATDNVDESVAVVTTNPVDESTLGDYVVRYNATDAAGNQATEVTRTVLVREVPDPTIFKAKVDILYHSLRNEGFTGSLQDMLNKKRRS